MFVPPKPQGHPIPEPMVGEPTKQSFIGKLIALLEGTVVGHDHDGYDSREISWSTLSNASWGKTPISVVYCSTVGAGDDNFDQIVGSYIYAWQIRGYMRLRVTMPYLMLRFKIIAVSPMTGGWRWSFNSDDPDQPDAVILGPLIPDGAFYRTVIDMSPYLWQSGYLRLESFYTLSGIRCISIAGQNDSSTGFLNPDHA